MALVSLVAAFIAFGGARLTINQLKALRQNGITGAFVYGFIFSLGTSVAPLLLMITVAASQTSQIYSMILAFAFGLGRGLPFLLIGVFSATIIRFTRLNVWNKAIQIISGIGLLIVSIYYSITFYDLL